MAIELSARASLLIQQRNLEPNIIVEIDGYDAAIFGALDIEKIPRYDEDSLYYDMPGLYYDGLIVDSRSKNYISLGGTGTTISQQLLQDKGSAQSVTTFNLELVDVNQEITQLITPGLVLDEIIGRKAKCYLNFSGGAHPEDSILFHRGIFSKVQSGPASVVFTISSPERQKRQQVFIQGNAVLSAGVNNIVTTIPVASTEGFFLPADGTTLRTYIQIGDEIIQYTGLTSTSFTGCTRGALGTTAAVHNMDDEATSLYRLTGNCIDMALKLMLSGSDLSYAQDNIKQFNYYTDVDSRRGVIFFNHYDIAEKRGIVVGSLVSVSGSANGNDASNLIVVNTGTNSLGSWIEVDYDFNDEFNSSAICSFISQYNVLSDGLGMTPEDVDIERHVDLQTRFASNLAEYDFYIKETINGDEFLPQQIYYPSGFYSLPRKSKSSIGITVPPIADQDIVFLDETNVVKPSQIKPERSVDANFYNAVLFKYEKDPIDDKYLRGKINYSSDSQTRIKNVGNKPIAIQSDGLRTGAGTDTLIRTSSRRMLERYQFAAEKLSAVQVFSKAGFTIEVGDVVVFGSPDLKISDITTGSREFKEKLYEVVNKSLDVKTGAVKLDLLSTNFAIDGRYGIVSPSSYVGSGSTTTAINIVDSFSTSFPKKEKDKWANYIGETILVHSVDWTYAHETTLVSINPTNDYQMLVDPPLPSPPLAGYLIDAPTYDLSTDPNVDARWKLIHCFFCPQIPVVTGINNTQFTIGAGDIGKIFVGSILRVHNYAFTVDSPEVIVSDITGVTVTVSTSLGFVPTSNELIDLVGFPDEGLPYRLI